MPAYNAEEYIQESIMSILEQTYQNIELIIINDNSIDSTLKIIHAINDRRIKVINNENNMGQSISMNIGLEIAKGTFIARQDADDISDGNRLFYQVRYLEKNPKCILLGTNAIMCNENAREIGRTKLIDDCKFLKWQLLYSNKFVHSSIMIRKNVLLKHNLRYSKLIYSQDYEFWNKISKYGCINILDDYLVKLRKHNKSKSSKSHIDKYQNPYVISHNAITSLIYVPGSNKYMHRKLMLNPTSLSARRAISVYYDFFKIFQKIIKTRNSCCQENEKLFNWIIDFFINRIKITVYCSLRLTYHLTFLTGLSLYIKYLDKIAIKRKQ